MGSHSFKTKENKPYYEKSHIYEPFIKLENHCIGRNLTQNIFLCKYPIADSRLYLDQEDALMFTNKTSD